MFYAQSTITVISEGLLVLLINLVFYAQSTITVISGLLVLLNNLVFYAQSTITVISGLLVLLINLVFYTQSTITVISGLLVLFRHTSNKRCLAVMQQFIGGIAARVFAETVTPKLSVT